MPYSSLLDEKDILIRIANSEERAFQELFNSYHQKVYSIGLRITRSEILAEDIVQDVFSKVWEKRLQLIDIKYINSWLRVVTQNVCCDYLRNLSIEKLALHKLVGEKNGSPISPENSIINKEYEEILENAISKLTPQQQKVYLLSRKYGMKQSEIAKQLDISVYTVKEYMKLALRCIKQQLEKKIDIALGLICLGFNFF